MRTDDRDDRTNPTRRRPRPRRVCLLWLLPAAACVLPTGCRGLGRPDARYDLLTAELRTRERELIDTRAERDQLRLLNQAYQRQLQHVGPAGPVAGSVSGHGDPGAPALPVRTVDLGAGTGGVDDDGRPGDESLMVVVVPRDDDGTAVKVPGRVAVTAFEVGPTGLKTPIGRWEVPPDQLKRTWKGGLLSTGYAVPLQWDKPPGTDRVRVVARLTTLDGREYEADKDVRVTPLPGVGPAGPPPAAAPPAGPELPPPGVPPAVPEQLPLPAARLRPQTPQ